MKTEILNPEQQNLKDMLDKYYPLDTVMNSMKTNLVHPNQLVRQNSQLLTYDCYQIFGWEEMKHYI